MTEYPFQLGEIITWLKAKELTLPESVMLDEVVGRGEVKPAAVADFTGAAAMGRITAWISGEFHLEVLRNSDGADLYCRHVRTSSLEELEPVYSEFLERLLMG